MLSKALVFIPVLVPSGCKVISAALGIPATFRTQRIRKSSFRIPPHRVHFTYHQCKPGHKANLSFKGCWESQYVAFPLLHEVAKRTELKIFRELANR